MFLDIDIIKIQGVRGKHNWKSEDGIHISNK